MAIWMDMTNSLQTWKGGVVGIVRAELEIAKNMKRCDPDVRFLGLTVRPLRRLGSTSWNGSGRVSRWETLI